MSLLGLQHDKPMKNESSTRFRNVLANKNQALRVSLFFNVVMIYLSTLFYHGWREAPHDINVHYPPNLMTTSVMKLGEVSSQEVYGFAALVYQQIYNWKKDGEKEFVANREQWRAMETPNFQLMLAKEIDERTKEGELSGRARTMKLLPIAYRDEFVNQIDPDHWRVWLFIEVQEFVGGKMVKDVMQRIPVRIARYAVDLDANGWQLALDGYEGQIIELQDEDIRKKYGVDTHAK